MRKQGFLPFFSIGIALFLFFNMPFSLSKRLREQTAHIFVSLSKITSFAKTSFQTVKKTDYDRIETENFLLKEQLKQVKEVLFVQDEADKVLEQVEHSALKEIFGYLMQESALVHAKVIYRDPHVWGSYLWVNQGSKTNERLKKTVIEKDSPVVIGNKLVGIVEEVFPTKSKIRLITDDGLRMAVCSYRGKTQQREIDSCLTLLEQLLPAEEPLSDTIRAYRQSLKEKKDIGPITRGEIFGCSLPLWKIHQNVLKGRGFHALQNSYKHDANLFRVGDLLFTAGVDDLFPEGLFVGTIQSISPLTEGSFHYQIDAAPAIGNLRDVTYVTIIPSLLSLQGALSSEE